ncbi:adenylate/guanylate cyclase domain-containing protein [Bradyrhizobium sp.]|uniref:adenylate/guanylate cyclase domain-containing protein n=1 Tax=Bradyrhizobium sp. TaxID=376 RepID=UPI003C51BE14
MPQDSSQSAERAPWIFSVGQRLVAQAGRIGAAPTDSTERALQKRLIVLLSVGLLPLTFLWSVIYFAAGARLSAAIPGLYTIIAPINTAVFASTRNLAVYRFIQLLIFLILPWLLMLSLGGFKDSSVVIIWAALCPLAALLLEELRQTLFWIVGFVSLLIASALLQPYLVPAGLSETFVTWFFVLNIGAVIAIAFALLYYFVFQRNFFQERSEMLLLNILPREISEALKANQQPIAAQYEDASILFADVVEFTSMAATMTPMRLVDLLNEVFQCFDDLVEKYDLEKIKTIGDCYMVAAGVPRSCPDHATRIVNLALDMRAAITERKFGDRELAFRIGVNSGPVVAGVIGRKKFIYDLWGDAVNIASRMESQGQNQCIQITSHTFGLIKDEFVCAARGPIKVKGGDHLEVWHVLARKAT